MSNPRIEALAKYLQVDADDLTESTYDETVIGFGHDSEYLVLTDDEADEKAKEYILDSLWAFNTSFILSHSKIADGESHDEVEKALSEMQGKLCESANAFIKALITDLDHFVSDAISADGRGHFLSRYDGEENEAGEYFIYRIN